MSLQDVNISIIEKYNLNKNLFPNNTLKRDINKFNSKEKAILCR